MSVRNILLRVLLSVALILNGATPAVASVHEGGMAEAMATQAASAAETPPCHQPHEEAAVSVPQAELAAAPTQPQPPHPAADCCESGACRCACMHPAPAAMPAVAFIAAMIEHAQSVRPMPSGHAAPALPHLIRPPIG